MSKMLEKATSDFRKKLDSEMKSVDVPEWGGKIHFKNVITLKEQGKMIELATQGKTVEALVESLIVKARNEDGSRMFTMADKITLLNEVDPKIIIRVVGEINAATEDLDSQEQVEKN